MPRREIIMVEQTEKLDLSTEAKIKEVARRIFTQKGYAATRTRDIAQEAGVNLALLNYYFRSKEKLFKMVISEELRRFFGVVYGVATNEAMDLDQKLETLIDLYTQMLNENPELPLFVFNEVQQNPQHFQEVIPTERILKNSALIKQFQERNPNINPIQFLYSFIGMLIFPYLSRPILGNLFKEDFQKVMLERKPLVLKWAKMMLDS